MPLQWLPLQQRQAQGGSPYSQALRPQGGGAMPQGKSFMEKHEEQMALEAERKYQEKMMKLQHDQQMEKMKFAAGLEEDVRKKARWQELSDRNRAEGLEQAQQQGAARQKIEDNPEPAAKEMYELLKTLPDEGKNQLLQQIFTPTSAGGTISSGGKTIQTAGKHNPIANVFLEKGWAMFDAKGNVNLSEPVKEFEKSTFETVEHDGNLYSYNTATGKEELIVKGSDVPESINTEQLMEVFKEGADYALGGVDPSYLENLSPEAKENYYEKLDTVYQNHVTRLLKDTYGLTLQEATRIANGLPSIKEDVENLGGGTTEPPKEGKDAPLDEEKAQGLSEFLEANPNANIEAYRDRDGDATVDRALEILGKKPEPVTTTTTKKKPKENEEPTSEGKGKTVSALKDALKKYKGL